MTICRHSWRTLAPDYLRSLAGLALTALPLAALPLAPVVAWTLGAGAALFAVYGLRTVLRHAAPVAYDEEGIAVGGLRPRRIAWRELRSMRLRHFSARPGGGRTEPGETPAGPPGGWFELTLAGPAEKVRIESTLPGFEDIVLRAARAAAAGGLALPLTTRGNLDVLGLS